MTREEWATKFLRGVGAPASKGNLHAIIAWIQAEGDGGTWNPLNSTHESPGATVFNFAGVKNYASAELGLDANIETLNYGADRGLYGYRKIRHRLRKDARPARTLRAVEGSFWGTGGLALRCLRDVRRAWDEYRNKPIYH